MGEIERTSILLTLVAVAGLTAYAGLRAMEEEPKPPVADPTPRHRYLIVTAQTAGRRYTG